MEKSENLETENLDTEKSETLKVVNSIIIDESKENPDLFFIRAYENNLSKKMCAKIIKYFEKEKNMDAYIGVDNSVMDMIHNKNENEIVINKGKRMKKCLQVGLYSECPLIFESIKKKLYVNLEKYIDKYTSDIKSKYGIGDFSPKYDIFGCQIQKYLKNDGYFKWHSDNRVSYIEEETHNDTYPHGTFIDRVFTYMWYVNDVEIGGETEFLDGKYKIRPKAGTLVIFPSTWTYIHKGNVPISDDKYIITGWIGDIRYPTPKIYKIYEFLQNNKKYLYYIILFLIFLIIITIFITYKSFLFEFLKFKKSVPLLLPLENSSL